MTKFLLLPHYFLRNLSIPKKMLLLSVLLLAPLLIQTGLFIQRTNADIEVARMELQGIEYSVALRKLQQLLPLYRGVSYALLEQGDEFKERKDQLIAEVEKAIEEIDRVDGRTGKQLKISEHWAYLKSRWETLSNAPQMTADEQFEEYSLLIDDLLATSLLVADNSGLVLDSNIETYYLMMVMVNEVPALIHTAQTLRGLSSASAAGFNTLGDKVRHMPTLVGGMQDQQRRVIDALTKVLQENPHLRVKMGRQLEKLLLQMDEFTQEMLKTDEQKEIVERFKLGSDTVSVLFDMYDLSAIELDALIQQNVERLERARNFVVISVVVCLMIGLYLFAGFYFSLRRDLIELVKASQRIGSGETESRINIVGRDELSVVAIGFNEMAAALEKSQQEVDEAYSKLESLTKSDPLTGLPNRRFLDEVLAREWHRAIRNDSSLSVIMLDLDHFKEYNDRYGHTAGDSCLCKVADELNIIMKRAGDFVARYGGEEFIIISPETTLDQAAELAMTIQKSIEKLAIPHEGSNVSSYVTVSQGVASIDPKKGNGTSKNLIESADRALYKAKAAGRNCYVLDTASGGTQPIKIISPVK